MANNLPIINRAAAEYTAEELEILSFVTLKNGRIRKSRPKYDNEKNPATGDAAYVWRHLVFSVSGDSQHQCMPVMDFCYIIHEGATSQERHENSRRRMDKLDKLVDKVLATIPKTEWLGVQRWARAMGYFG